MLISEHITPVMLTDSTGYLPQIAKFGISVGIGVLAFMLFAPVTVITAIVIAAVSLSILDFIDESVEASKLENELELELQDITDESIRTTYRLSAEDAIGFRKGFAFAESLFQE